ncbi:MAG TPA: hypothetical protein VK989_12545 [Polyangia bacterium]|nr:hypothetical protein [Polyangia bacterium]
MFGVGLFALSFAGASCRKVQDPALVQLFEARRLAAELRARLAQASDASDRAVMADTDEASIAFAKQAEAATATVADEAAALLTRLQGLSYAAEAQTLKEFDDHFADYRKLDHDVLELSVQNTNLKAQRLSFGPIREAADGFCASVRAAAQAVAGKDRCGADALAMRAELAVREIQILQAPHIAEADDATMTRLEAEMSARQATARDALVSLAKGAGGDPKLAAATAALDRFEKVSSELVALSRRNSNVRSLELALRRKPVLTAACDSSLAALEDALAKEGLGGTR